MNTRAFLPHALSRLHAGTGQAADVIDLPTARMKATGIPFLPGSSIKGVLRDARRAGDRDKTEAVFGSSHDPAARAGALVVRDIRLLALPVRSHRGTCAWTTSPLMLTLAKPDCDEAALPIPSITGRGARLARGSRCIHQGRPYLQDLGLPATESNKATAWARRLASPVDEIFTKRFAVVDDDTMAFLWETATQVDAGVREGPR